MKLHPCFKPPKALEAAARLAEQRKHQAIERLTEKLASPNDRSHRAMVNLVDADKAAHSPHVSEALREKVRS